MPSLCVIPARGGSKRIPRKNIREFLGKPILAYSIRAALEAGLFDTVMVSTEDDDIAEIARGSGAEVPFMRSKRTADDHAPLAEVLLEVLDMYRKAGTAWDIIGCVLPTAPLLSADDIVLAADVMEKRNAAGVFSLARFSYPIQRAQKLNDDGYMEMVWPEHMFTRSQDLPPRFHDAGQFYIITADALTKHKSLFPPRVTGYELPETRVQDIDTEEDWVVAEMKYRMAHDE